MIEDELQQWLTHTENLIADLIADESNEEVDHTIEHHFSSANFELLEAAAVTAFKKGYDVEEPEEAETDSGEKVFSFDIITEQPLELDIISDETKIMYQLAKQCEVDYDGWGTYFEE